MKSVATRSSDQSSDAVGMKKSDLVDVLMILLYKVALDVSFAFFVKPLYDGEPELQSYGPENAGKIIAGYFVTLACFWLFRMAGKRGTVSRFIIFVQYIFIVIPYTTIYGIEDLPTTYLSLVLIGYVTVTVFVRLIPPIKLRPAGALIRYIFAAIAGLIMLYVFGGLIMTGGLQRLNFNLADVYTVRAEYVQNLLPGFGYFVAWTGYVFDMILLVLFLQRRKERRRGAILGILLTLSLQLLLFGMTNFKTFLFVPFAIMGLMWTSQRMHFHRAFLIGGLGIIGALLLADTISPFGTALLKRVYIDPAAMHNLYFEYFSSHPLASLSGEAVGTWLGAPYTQFPLQLVADHYLGTAESPNAGWMADAFANFGVVGVFLYGAILAFLLRLGDFLAKKISDPGVAEGLMLTPAVVLCSSALGTALLTHGLLVLLMALWVIRVNHSMEYEASWAT